MAFSIVFVEIGLFTLSISTGVNFGERYLKNYPFHLPRFQIYFPEMCKVDLLFSSRGDSQVHSNRQTGGRDVGS